MKKENAQVKRRHHPRNRFEGRYDLQKLARVVPELQKMIVSTKSGFTLDFSKPEAVEILNRALLKDAYGLKYWHIPKGFLCPPVPGRLDYVHTIADILATSNGGRFPRPQKIRILDIGTGSSLIYPLLINYEYGWTVVASDVSEASLVSARLNLDRNGIDKGRISIRKQDNPDNFFKNIIQLDEYFDFTMCNPPFYKDKEEADSANLRKNRNIHKEGGKDRVRNFQGTDIELIYPGGEKKFLSAMIRQSRMFGNQVLWFSSLVSSQGLMSAVKSEFSLVRVAHWNSVDLSHGNKKSRMVYWSFLNRDERENWKEKRWK